MVQEQSIYMIGCGALLSVQHGIKDHNNVGALLHKSYMPNVVGIDLAVRLCTVVVDMLSWTQLGKH
jgi:hypothetical protein